MIELSKLSLLSGKNILLFEVTSLKEGKDTSVGLGVQNLEVKNLGSGNRKFLNR